MVDLKPVVSRAVQCRRAALACGSVQGLPGVGIRGALQVVLLMKKLRSCVGYYTGG